MLKRPVRCLLWLLLSASLVAAGVAVPDDVPDGFRPADGVWPEDPETGFIKKTPLAGLEKLEAAHYHLCVPEDYDPEEAWPLVIVLHGGPGGKASAMASVFALGFRELGAISVYPQALKKQLLEWNYPHEGMYLLRIIRQVAETYRIDPRRVYLAGHSMGGGGTWLNGAILRDIWAGIAPMSGWYAPTPKPDPKLYLGLPIYCIHGDKDKAVPVQLSRMADKELKGLKHAAWNYVELEGVGHNIFKKAQKPELKKMAEWLLEQKRVKPANMRGAGTALVKWGRRFGWQHTGGPIGSYAGDDDDGE